MQLRTFTKLVNPTVHKKTASSRKIPRLESGRISVIPGTEAVDKPNYQLVNRFHFFLGKAGHLHNKIKFTICIFH